MGCVGLCFLLFFTPSWHINVWRAKWNPIEDRKWKCSLKWRIWLILPKVFSNQTLTFSWQGLTFVTIDPLTWPPITITKHGVCHWYETNQPAIVSQTLQHLSQPSNQSLPGEKIRRISLLSTSKGVTKWTGKCAAAPLVAKTRYLHAAPCFKNVKLENC